MLYTNKQSFLNILHRAGQACNAKKTVSHQDTAVR